MDVTEIAGSIGRANLSYADYVDWKKNDTVFSSLAIYTPDGYMLPSGEGSELVAGIRVSDDFFRTLGVKPALGRDFYAGEDQPGAPMTTMLSYAAWQARDAGSASDLGKTVDLSGKRGLVLKEAGRLTGMGIVAGMVCAIGAATLLRTLLFGTAAWDVPTLLAVGVVLAVCAMVASYIPARRAASVNPVEALRAE